MASVLQEWVNEIPLKEAGVVVMALRGPDGVRKEHPSKNVVRAFRAVTMVSGVTGRPLTLGEDVGEFMQMHRIGCPDPAMWNETMRLFFAEWDSYNVHFLLHLMHAASIVGFRHPNEMIMKRWWDFYITGCGAAHLMPEVPHLIRYRLRSPPRDHWTTELQRATGGD